jgi:death on curing protein
MRFVTAQEIIQIHDDILSRLAGVKGMADPGRAEAIMSRVHNHVHYAGISDPFDIAATLLISIAKGHIFNDGNKRTALMTTLYFLFKNDIQLNKSSQLEEWTVEAATNLLTVSSLAQNLKSLAHRS